MTGQNIYQKDSVIYTNAYRYIIKDSTNLNKSIILSDSIVDLDKYWSSGLDSFPKEKEILNQYRERKKYQYFKAFFSQVLNSLSNEHKTSHHSNSVILFFSKIENYTLRADVLPLDNKYTDQTRIFDYTNYDFGEGYEYLFILNPDGSIKLALKQQVIRN